MKVGMFGKAGVGKSSLFRSLAGGETQGKSAGICTIKVPDERVDRMTDLFKPKKVTYVSITFEEIDPGEHELIGNDAALKIRGVEVLALVVRGFVDDFHPAPPEGIDPVRDFHTLQADLITNDYLVAQKRIERMNKEKKHDSEWAALNKAVAALEAGIPIRKVDFSGEELRILSGFRFLSQPPLLLVLNVGEGDLGANVFPELDPVAAGAGVPLIRLSAKIEEEIAQLSEDEQAGFLKELGIAASARDRLVKAAFDAMDYICFLTVGEDEVRAWNIRRGMTAVAAAGRIHSDLEKGFIRAEVVAYEELLRCQSFAKAKTDGKFRLEGKEYVVRDGDIMHVRFNV
jgi:GTP-binding protein YchF